MSNIFQIYDDKSDHAVVGEQCGPHGQGRVLPRPVWAQLVGVQLVGNYKK